MSDRQEWLEQRRKGVGASDVPAIIGCSPWASAWSVWAEKVGLTPVEDGDQTDAMRFGHDLEPIIADWFHRETGLRVVSRQEVVHHGEYHHHFATLDGLVSDDAHILGVFESKSTSQNWNRLPEHVEVQVQWQLHCTNHDRAWVAAMMFPFGRVTFRVFPVERDNRRIASLVKQVEQFWQSYVVTGDLPPIDAHPATAGVIDAVWGSIATEKQPTVDLTQHAKLVARYRELSEERRRIDAELDQAKAQLKALFVQHGPELSEGVINGVLAVSWRSQTRTSIDAEAVRRDHGDAYDRTTTVRVLRTHNPK